MKATEYTEGTDNYRGYQEDIHRSQIISYLTATGIRIGLLLNFGKTKLEIDRIMV